MKLIRLNDYRAIAAFRFHIRQYLDFSNSAARSAGLDPKQYELLLAIKGLPEGTVATIGVVAEQLYLRHHSAVELVNRAEKRGFVRRSRISKGRTYVLVELTAKGERIINRVVALRLKELRRAGPVLVDILSTLAPTKKGRGVKR
jgi:DNA-binding MarR family transcriptional regulator